MLLTSPKNPPTADSSILDIPSSSKSDDPSDISVNSQPSAVHCNAYLIHLALSHSIIINYHKNGEGWEVLSIWCMKHQHQF